MFSYVQNL
jgi:hypothetical protein